MSDIPKELRYTASHEWVREEGDGVVAVGITHHAQEQLGDLVFVELPETGTTVSAAEEFGVVESVKAASDLYSPVTGEVVAVNEALAETPETINADPYGDGWLIQVRLDDPGELDGLLDAEGYAAHLEDED